MLSKRNGQDADPDGLPDSRSGTLEEWCEAKPAVIPEPTAWPMVLALSGTISLWGILTSWVFVVVGLLLGALSLFQWIEEMRK